MTLLFVRRDVSEAASDSDHVWSLLSFQNKKKDGTGSLISQTGESYLQSFIAEKWLAGQWVVDRFVKLEESSIQEGTIQMPVLQVTSVADGQIRVSDSALRVHAGLLAAVRLELNSIRASNDLTNLKQIGQSTFKSCCFSLSIS